MSCLADRSHYHVLVPGERIYLHSFHDRVSVHDPTYAGFEDPNADGIFYPQGYPFSLIVILSRNPDYSSEFGLSRKANPRMILTCKHSSVKKAA